MKGKSTFTKTEAEAIVVLIKQKLKVDSITQKSIRNRIRALGFYASDFGLNGGYKVEDFLRVVKVIEGNAPSAIYLNQEVIPKLVKTEPRKDLKIENKILGLAPIVNQHSKVLILGTMPSVESLRKQAYYGNNQNLFWKLMAKVTGKEVPLEYEERKEFLLANNIALWDMCQTCLREGSLDSAISEETPNDIPSFVQKHPGIKAIAFNGKASARLFAKYFGSIQGIELYSMPSTSPANARIAWEVKVGEWSKIKAYLYE